MNQKLKTSPGRPKKLDLTDRKQIQFEIDIFEELSQEAKEKGVSVAALIREITKTYCLNKQSD